MNEHSRTLRLDPRHPLVWRTPTSMQLGIDTALVRLDTVSHAHERMLHAMVTGVSLEGLRMIGARSGAPPRSVARLLRRVAPALVRPGYGADAVAFAPAPLAGCTVAVGGGSAARPAVEGLLRALGAEPPGGAGGAALGAEPGAPVDLAVIVSSWSTPPSEAAGWLRRDIPHLDVVFSDTGVTVGPLVVPGAGACLHCRERHRIDADPSWPAIAGQLYGSPAPTEVPLTIARVLPVVAGLCVAHLRGRGPGAAGGSAAAGVLAPAGGSAAPGAVTHIDAVTGDLRVSQQSVHPECACRALPETSTARAPASDSPQSRPTREAAVVSRG